MANIEKIVLPDNTEYEVHDANALPKTAGADEPLTDDLWINHSNNDIRINLTNSNATELLTGGVVQDVPTYNFTELQTVSSGASKSGIRCYRDGTVYIYGGGNPIRLLPNGVSDTTHQIYVDTAGEMHGGHFINTQTRTVTTSISGQTWTTVVGNTGLDAAGRYIFICSCQFTGNYTGGIAMRIIDANGVTTPIDDRYVTAASWRLIYPAIVTGSSNYMFQLNTGGSGRTGTTAVGASITAIRIG